MQESFQLAYASRWMANCRNSWWNTEAALHPRTFLLSSNSEAILTKICCRLLYYPTLSKGQKSKPE